MRVWVVHASHDTREVRDDGLGDKSRDIRGSEWTRRILRDTRRCNSRSSGVTWRTSQGTGKVGSTWVKGEREFAAVSGGAWSPRAWTRGVNIIGFVRHCRHNDGSRGSCRRRCSREGDISLRSGSISKRRIRNRRRCIGTRARAMDHRDAVAQKGNISEDTGGLLIVGCFQKIQEEIMKVIAVRETAFHAIEEFDTSVFIHVASVQNVGSAKMSDVEILEAIESELLFGQVNRGVEVTRVHLYRSIVMVMMGNMRSKNLRVRKSRTGIVQAFGRNNFMNETVHQSEM